MVRVDHLVCSRFSDIRISVVFNLFIGCPMHRFFYWIFPSLFPRLQRFTVQQKQRWIIYNFLIQLFGGIGVFVVIGIVLGVPDFQFTFATWWPVSRLGLFIMVCSTSGTAGSGTECIPESKYEYWAFATRRNILNDGERVPFQSGLYQKLLSGLYHFGSSGYKAHSLVLTEWEDRWIWSVSCFEKED